MKALVTGATGFIGSFLVRELQNRGFTVRALVLPGEEAGTLERSGVEIRRGDLTQLESLARLCEGVDIVFHLAGRVTDWGKRRDFFRAILEATKNLLEEAAGKAPRFLYVSSIAALGIGRHLNGVTETGAALMSGVPYGDAKLQAEWLVHSFNYSGKIDCTIVRPANVIGPGSVWVRDILDRYRTLYVPLIDEGRHSASLVSVDNLVDAIILAATADAAVGKLYHLRDDWEVTWKQYLTDLGAMIGKHPRGNLPFALAWGMGWLMDKICAPLRLRPPLTRLAVAVMGRNNDVDASLARMDLGWKSRVSYKEAMERIAGWVSERYS